MNHEERAIIQRAKRRERDLRRSGKSAGTAGLRSDAAQRPSTQNPLPTSPGAGEGRRDDP